MSRTFQARGGKASVGGVRPRSSATLSIPYRPWMPGNPAGEHESAAVGLHGKALAPNADAMRQQPCLLSLGSLALDPNATGACSVKQSPKGVPAGSAIGTRDPALEDVSSGFTAPAPRRPQRLFPARAAEHDTQIGWPNHARRRVSPLRGIPRTSLERDDRTAASYLKFSLRLQ
jgi:hypothetical protein